MIVTYQLGLIQKWKIPITLQEEAWHLKHLLSKWNVQLNTCYQIKVKNAKRVWAPQEN